jgi:hypothetical protein
MENHFRRMEGKWLSFACALCVLVAVSLATKFNLPYGLLLDSFHYGEYFASLTSLVGGTSTFHPLVIHGALDYIPGLAMLHAFGDDSYFFPTWLLYRLLDLAAAILFLIVAFQATRHRPRPIVMLVALAIATPFYVGYRDVFLLLAIGLFLLIQAEHRRLVHILLQASFGLVAAFGMYWSFDRGIAGAIGLGAASMFFAYQDRRYVVSIATFFLAMLLAGYLFPGFALNTYVGNVRFLVATSSDWSYGWKLVPVILTLLSLLLNILANWLLWSFTVGSNRSRAHVANAIFLSVLSIILFKIGTNRADEDHITWSLWVPLLICLYGFSFRQRAKREACLSITALVLLSAMLVVEAWYRFSELPWPLAERLTLPILLAIAPILTLGMLGAVAACHSRRAMTAARTVISATLLVPLLAASYAFSSEVAKGDYRWVMYYQAVPSNSDMVPFGVRWVSQELVNHHANCVLDFTNSGVINGVTGLPACTRFTYLIYATQRYEDEIIAALRAQGPKAVVYSLSDWSYFIGGKPMPDRFPRLNKFLLENYPRQDCAYSYCVRYQE